jgi:hypothetical protein
LSRAYSGRTCLSAGALQRFDGRKEVTRDEHELEIERSGDVLNRRQARVSGAAFEVRDLALAQAELLSEILLAELFALAGVTKDVGKSEWCIP